MEGCPSKSQCPQRQGLGRGVQSDAGGCTGEEICPTCRSVGCSAAGRALLAAGRIERVSVEMIFIGKRSFAEINPFCGNT